MPDRDTTATAAGPQGRLTPRPADDPTYHVDPGKGWVLFAGIMLALIGALNVAYGIAAISDSTFYVRNVQFIIADLKTFGWFLTVIGAIQVVVAIGIWRESEAGSLARHRFRRRQHHRSVPRHPGLPGVGGHGLHGRRDRHLRPPQLRRPRPPVSRRLNRVRRY